jgi:hypothetical protein
MRVNGTTSGVAVHRSAVLACKPKSSECKRPDPPLWRRAGTCHPHRAFTARMTETIPIKEFDGFPSDLVRPHPVRRGNPLGIFDAGVLIWPEAD